MIPIYRKLRKKMADDNKPMKYMRYAFGEIILVVIGILIALQINNWNLNRIDRNKEHSILNSIHKEFKTNRVQLDTVMFYHRKVSTSCEKLISMFPIDIERDNLDTISKHLYNVLFNWTFNPSQGSINGIINTSSLDIIRDEELRGILVSWQDLILDFQEDEINSKNVVFNSIDPFLAPNIDFNINLKDKRNNLEVLETLHFEYLIHLKRATLEDLFKPGAELEILEKNLTRIIELTKPKL